MVRDTLSQNGALMAVPTGIHRVNWLWLNRKVFERQGLKPHRLGPVRGGGGQAQGAGHHPLAIGNEPWQIAVLFETVASAKGQDLHRKAFLEQDSATPDRPRHGAGADPLPAVARLCAREIRRPEMAPGHQPAGERRRRHAGDGDWVKGELSAGNYRPGEDIECLPSPGSQGLFSYNLDSIAMFKQRDPAQLQAQGELARLLMTPRFQEEFNRVKAPSRRSSSRT